MTYSAEISRANPVCFLFLIDQSGSMSGPIGGQTGRRKEDGVADAVNRLLDSLVQRCSKGEEVRDYFDVGVVRYMTDQQGSSIVGSAFAGELSGRPLVPISEIANNPARLEERTHKVEDGAGGLVEETIRFPVWFDPVSTGGTPMAAALELAFEILQGWIQGHPNSNPPIVINITDGEATDKDPEPAAQQLRSLSTTEGPVLLFNIHLSEMNAQPVMFPMEEYGLPGDYASQLCRMSSPLPDSFREAGKSDGLSIEDGARGFVFNADMSVLVQFLDIGTRPVGDLR